MGKPSGNQTWLAENLPPKWMFLGKTMELNWEFNQQSSNKDQASATIWADMKWSTDVPSLMGHEFYPDTLVMGGKPTNTTNVPSGNQTWKLKIRYKCCLNGKIIYK